MTYANVFSKENLRKLYDFNGKITDAIPKSTNLKAKSVHDWGGPTTRLALHAIYTLAFICLLRSDEVLKIRRQDLQLMKEVDGSVYIIVTLPFRKTHQDGREFFFLMDKSKFIHALIP
jgi:hypothetical protein